MKYKPCPYCKTGSDCPCQDIDSNFSCTRNKGHDGPHVACGSSTHYLSIWNNTSDEELRDENGKLRELVIALKETLDEYGGVK